MSDDQKMPVEAVTQQEQQTSTMGEDEQRATADITHATLNPAQPTQQALYPSQPQEGAPSYNSRGELPPVEVENYFHSIERSSQPTGGVVPQALMNYDDHSSIVTLAGTQPSSFYTKTAAYPNPADVYKTGSMFAPTTTPLLSHAYTR